MADLLKAGASLDAALSRTFEVTDEVGRTVLRMPFDESVREEAANETITFEMGPGFW